MRVWHCDPGLGIKIALRTPSPVYKYRDPIKIGGEEPHKVFTWMWFLHRCASAGPVLENGRERWNSQ